MKKNAVDLEKHAAHWNAVLDLDDYRYERFEPDLYELLSDEEEKVTALSVPGYEGKVFSFQYPLPAYQHQVLIVSDADFMRCNLHSAYPVSRRSALFWMKVHALYPWQDMLEAEMLSERDENDGQPPAFVRFFVTNHAEIAGEVFPGDRVRVALSALLVGQTGLRDYRSFVPVNNTDPAFCFRTEARMIGQVRSLETIVDDEDDQLFYHLEVEGHFETDPDVTWVLPVLASSRILGTAIPKVGDAFSGLVWLHGYCLA